MAEFGVIGSIVGIASAGIKLSSTLYTYSQTVYRADSGLQDVAQDVSLTSAVLTELGDLLKKERDTNFCSANAIKTADDAIKGCKSVFEEIETLVEGSSKKGNLHKTLSTLGRLKWPLSEKKVEYLRSNLDRLRTTLSLLLQVLNYGTLLKSRMRDTDLGLERYQIEQLAAKSRIQESSPSLLMQSLDPAATETECPVVQPTSMSRHTITLPHKRTATDAGILPAASDTKFIDAANSSRQLFLDPNFLEPQVADHTKEDFHNEHNAQVERNDYESFRILIEQLSTTDIVNCQEWLGSVHVYLQAAQVSKENFNMPEVPSSTQTMNYLYMSDKLDKIFECSRALHEYRLDFQIASGAASPAVYDVEAFRIGEGLSPMFLSELLQNRNSSPSLEASSSSPQIYASLQENNFEPPITVEPPVAVEPRIAAEPPVLVDFPFAFASRYPGRQHKESQSSFPEFQTEDTNTRGIIRGVTENMDISALDTALNSIVKLFYLDIDRQKNCAFVDFATPADFCAAVRANPYEVAGERLYVEERRVGLASALNAPFDSYCPPSLPNSNVSAGSGHDALMHLTAGGGGARDAERGDKRRNDKRRGSLMADLAFESILASQGVPDSQSVPDSQIIPDSEIIPESQSIPASQSISARRSMPATQNIPASHAQSEPDVVKQLLAEWTTLDVGAFLMTQHISTL